MPDELTGGREPRRRRRVLGDFKLIAALVIAPILFVVIVVALVTVVMWLVLGVAVWFVGVAAGIRKPDAGRRLRSGALHLLRSGPSRWLVKAAVHRARRAWSRSGSSRDA
jgi:hypothetical protein